MSNWQEKNTQKWDDTWEIIKGNNYPHEQLVKYVNIKAPFPVMKALDIGFGSAANMRFLSEKGFSVSGIEVSKSALRKARQKAKEWNVNFDLRLFEPPFLPYEDNTLGFICSIEAIYYNIDLEAVIDEIYRILAPGGKFYISFRTPRHGVIKSYAKPVGKTLMEWKNSMPVRQMAGIRFRCFRNKRTLYSLFNRFENVRVDTLWTDLLGQYFELLLVTGEKNNKGL